MTNTANISNTTTWKLKRYYYFVQISGIVVLTLFLIAVYKYQTYFNFFGESRLVLFLISSILITHTLLFALQEIFQKRIFFTLSRYAWILFFISGVYTTGGIQSQFLFLLLFPLLTAGTNLDAKETKWAGIVLVFLFGSFIFIAPDPITPQIFVKHIARTFLFAVVSYYVYKLVKETLLHKFEKEEAKRKFAELIELDQVKDDFITVASHQLRTPLSGIRWALSGIVEDSTLSPETRAIIKNSLEATDKSMAIINELILTSDKNVASFTLINKEVDLGKLLREVYSDVQYLIEENKVRLVFLIEDSIKISGDPEKLKIAFVNVLDNGVRYSPNGHVTIKLTREEQTAVIKIKDNGIGMSEEDKGHIFDRFFRSKEALQLAPNETGIGLYICRKIIEKHFGSVEIFSVKGEGTEVIVKLPLLP